MRLAIVLTVLWLSMALVSEGAHLRVLGYQPRPGGHLEISFDENRDGEPDFWLLMKIRWEGRTMETDEQLRERALTDGLAYVAIEGSNPVRECKMDHGTPPAPCRIERYVYLVNPQPVRECTTQACRDQPVPP